MHRRQLRPRRFERNPGRDAAEELRHTMRTIGDHRGPEMMRARHHVRDDLGVGRIRHGWLEDANHRGGTRPEPDGLADHRRIALERRGPEPVREDGGARRLGTIVLSVQQPTEHRAQPHHVEERAADDARLDHARLAAEPSQREVDRGEVPKRADRGDVRCDVGDFGNRERRVLGADAGRALADVDEAIFVAIDQRAQQHAPDDAEYRGVGTDAEGERHHHRGCQALGAS